MENLTEKEEAVHFKMKTIESNLINLSQLGKKICNTF